MAREDTPLDQAVFDATLEDELEKGADRRVAEGRARSAGGARLQGGAPGGGGGARSRGGGSGGRCRRRRGPAAAAAPAAAAPAARAAAAVAAPVTTPVRTRPLRPATSRHRRRVRTTSTACWRSSRPKASSGSSVSRATA